jgi:cytidine deaminase
MPRSTPGPDDAILARLREAAQSVVKNSYSPYSSFPVGAAILTGAGTIHTGTNVENASYGLSICAERAAMLQAIAAGHTDPIALVVYAPTTEPAVPCGACRQFLAEFNPQLPVYCVGAHGLAREQSLDVLLPDAFRLRGKP